MACICPRAVSPRLTVPKFLTITVAGLLLLVTTSSVVGGEGAKANLSKPAWRWTLDERLARRFDKEAMSARNAERETRARATLEHFPEMKKDFPAEKAREESGPTIDVVEGRLTPELYLPWELFNSLLNRAFPPDGQYGSELRRPIEQRAAAALGFGSDLWDRLATAAGPFLKLQREEDRLRGTHSAASSLNQGDHRVRLCRARADALEAAKQVFGEETFLRFLYEAVAPEVQLTYVVDENLPDQLRSIEGGCR